MQMERAEALRLVQEMPDRFDLEELQYRFYLKQKLEAAEEDVRAGRVLAHEQVIQETAKWFEE